MDRSDLIDRYIQQKATAAELEKIKLLMAEDAEFREEIAFHTHLQAAVKKEEAEALKARLKALEQQRPVSRMRRHQAWWKVAAVLLLGIGVWWVSQTSSEHEKIYAEHFSPYPNIVSPAVRGTDHVDQLSESAFRDYERRNYPRAAAAFRTLYLEDHIAYANFYYAMSLMADGKVSDAIRALEDPDWEAPENLRAQRLWYLALAHLKTGHTDRAVTYLHELSQHHNRMADKAKKLLSRIE